MVLINNEYNFKIYELDTAKTSIERLASDMNTSPRYLFFPSGIPTIHQLRSGSNDIPAENILSILTDPSHKSFIRVYEIIKDKRIQQNLDVYSDILLPFLAYNPMFGQNSVIDINTLALLTQTELNNHTPSIFVKDVNIYDALKEVPDTINHINIEINETKKTAQSQLQQLLYFDSITTGVMYTPFKTDTLKFSYILNNVHMSVMEIFNHIRLTEHVPFASINSMYKILKDFIPTSEWDDTKPDTITCKILQPMEVSDNVTFSDYTTATISVTGDPGSETVEIYIVSDNKTGYVTKDILVDRMTALLSGTGSFSIGEYTERNVKGIYYIPKHDINHSIFTDLIMNHPLFNTFMSVDESEKATKRKEGTYVHVDEDEIGHMSVNITDQLSFKGSQDLKGFNVSSVFGYNEPYVRVRISSAHNLSAIRKFQQLYSKLMILYDNEFQALFDYYVFFIPAFGDIQKKQLKTDVKQLKLKDIEPEIFVKGYPPKCPFQPTIIEDDDVNETLLNGQDVMTFPKQDTIPGVISRNYICNHTDAIYPGLRKNPLGNKEKIPFLPCCYVKDPKQKEGSVYRHYYFDERLADKIDVNQPAKITTNKFVNRDTFGELPSTIKDILTIIQADDTFEFVRKGVNDSKHSFIECVMEGMYQYTDVLNTSERDAFVLSKRKETRMHASVCKQEMYDFTIDEIKKMITNPSVYFDPELFVHLMEIVFKCNIYVFRKEGLVTQLLTPRHLQSYYKTENAYKTVLIYEHTGSISDHAKYPRCELIVKLNKNTDETAYHFDNDSAISKGILNTFTQLNTSYALTQDISMSVFPLDISRYFSHQSFDSYGKCRLLSFSYDNEEGTIMTEPLQPVMLPELSTFKLKEISKQTAIRLLSEWNVQNVHQYISEQNNLKEISGSIGTVTIYIPIASGTRLSGIPYYYTKRSYIQTNTSEMEAYTFSKKMARYLTEYMLWLFSAYIHDQNNDTRLQSIKEFVNTYTQVIPSFEYGAVDKRFSLDSGVMKENKLILTSDEMLKRLVFVLRNTIHNNKQVVIDYHKHTTIQRFYEDISDFDTYKEQVLLKGTGSIIKWIYEYKPKYELFHSVQLDTHMYFLKNELIMNGNIILVKHANNLKDAIRTSITWVRRGYNDTIEPFENVQYTLYRYVSPDNVNTYTVKGVKTNMNIHILGYKNNDDTFFLSLLKL